MLYSSLPLLLAALTTAAAGDTLYDQIGNNAGDSLTGDIYSSMHFLPVLPETSDIAAVDAVTIAERSDVDGVEFVLNGWGGFEGPAAVTNWQVNVYSDLVEGIIIYKHVSSLFGYEAPVQWRSARDFPACFLAENILVVFWR